MRKMVEKRLHNLHLHFILIRPQEGGGRFEGFFWAFFRVF